VIVSNVLTEEKKELVLTLGRLGWSLRRIEKQTGIRRETAAAYLKTFGVAVCSPTTAGDGARRQNRPMTNEVFPKPCDPSGHLRIKTGQRGDPRLGARALMESSRLGNRPCQ